MEILDADRSKISDAVIPFDKRPQTESPKTGPVVNFDPTWLLI